LLTIPEAVGHAVVPAPVQSSGAHCCWAGTSAVSRRVNMVRWSWDFEVRVEFA
jgi:hypothetical protein